MLCIRFSLLIFITLSFNTFALEKFSSRQCLDANFETDVKQGKKFFGLLKSNLEIKKDKCIIKIKYKNITEKEWLVDICRQPIHMKITSSVSQDVYKRDKGCEVNSKSEFCENWNELSDVIQDYGLIYAKGLREELSSSHGMTFCTFLLLKKHLEQGVLFSAFEETPDIFIEGGCSIVSKKEPSENQTVPSPIVIEEKNEVQVEKAPIEEDRF